MDDILKVIGNDPEDVYLPNIIMVLPVLVIALFTIPIDKEYTIIPKVLIMNNWRIFQFICTLFPIAGFLFFLLLPESPAFLLRSGREKEAIEVLREIYVTNTNNPPETFDVRSFVFF